MGEKQPLPIQPEIETVQYGSFTISRKTRLAGVNTRLDDIQTQVGKDILQNAKEVFPAEIKWPTLLDILILSKSGKKGAYALINTYGYTMGTTAQSAEWDMDDRNVVFMCAQHILTATNRHISQLGELLGKIKERNFLTESAREEQQVKEGSRLTILKENKELMDPSLRRYVEEVLGNDRTYAYLLQQLFYVNHRTKMDTRPRRKLIDYIKDHNYDEAFNILIAHPIPKKLEQEYPPLE